MAIDIMMYYDYGIKIVAAISFIGCFYFAAIINKSVGFNFLRAMGKAKMAGMKNQSVIVLRIRDLAGGELYQTKEVSEFIKYKFKQNGIWVDKAVIYNERAVTIWNGVKILGVSPSSVLPIDRDTGLFVNVNPELTNKIVTDSGKTAESDKDSKELLKNGLWIAGILIFGTIAAITYMYDGNMETVGQLKACYASAKTSATIIATG